MEFNNNNNNDNNNLANGVPNPSSNGPVATDDQLIINYLNPQVIEGQRTPFFIIHTYMEKWTSPQELCLITPEERDSHRYFYVRRGILDADANGNAVAGRSGCWELASEDVEQISFNDRKIGEKRKLIYFEADGSRTPWIMHEYKAVIAGIPNYIEERAVYKLRDTGDLNAQDEEEAGDFVFNVGGDVNGDEEPEEVFQLDH